MHRIRISKNLPAGFTSIVSKFLPLPRTEHNPACNRTFNSNGVFQRVDLTHRRTRGIIKSSQGLIRGHRTQTISPLCNFITWRCNHLSNSSCHKASLLTSKEKPRGQNYKSLSSRPGAVQAFRGNGVIVSILCPPEQMGMWTKGC